MRRAELDELLAVRDFPCITITLPTHRGGRDSREDAIRLKNLVRRAIEEVPSTTARAAATAALGHLEGLKAEVEAGFPFTRDGIALFASPGLARRFELPFPVRERVVVDRAFHLRELILASHRTARWLCLVLGEEPARLFEGHDERLFEVHAHGFPAYCLGQGRHAAERLEGTVANPRGLERQPPRGASFAQTTNDGFEATTVLDAYRRHFLDSVDAGLRAVLGPERLPVVLVGLERSLAAFRQVTRHGRLVAAAVAGNHDDASSADLAKLTWPLVTAWDRARRVDRARRRLDAAFKARRCVAGLEGAALAASEGRGALLLIEEGFRAAGPKGEDALGDVVEEVVRNGGEVTFVPDGSLAEHGRIALALRYALPDESKAA